MNFAYNVRTDRIQIQCKAVNNQVFSSAKYSTPVGGVTPSVYTIVPVINVTANIFSQIIGVNPGFYPPNATIGALTTGTLGTYYVQPSTNSSPVLNTFNGIQVGSTYPNPINQIFDGTMSPKIGTPYVPLYYKPSNSKFATQGSVDASSRLARLKYDTITSSASTFTTAYGRHTANALAYGVPGPGATFKERIGYSTSCQPTANLITNQMMKCTTTKIRGG